MQQFQELKKVVAMCDHCRKVIEGNSWVFEKWKNCGDCGEQFTIIQEDIDN